MKFKNLFVLGCLLLSGCISTAYVEVLPTLKGKTMDEIRSQFGHPNIIHHEKHAELWSYNREKCICLIFFDKSETVQYAETRGECPEL